MKLSILIAAYNVEKFIRRCVESCVNQNLPNSQYEILVVDDGSTDNTTTILEGLSKEISNLRLIQQKNSGIGTSRNIGLLASKGQYVWFIDGDDFIETDNLDNILKQIEQTPDVIVLNCMLKGPTGEDVNAEKVNWPAGKKHISGGEFYLNNYDRSYTWMFIFRKSILIDNNLCFRPKINMQDSEILPRILLFAEQVVLLYGISYYYVQHASSFSNTNNSEKRYRYFESIIEVRDSLRKFHSETDHSYRNLKEGLQKKIIALHTVVFYHLLFFRYNTDTLQKILQLLRANGFYPLKAKLNGKLWVIKSLMNIAPLDTKRIVDKLRHN